MICHQGSTRTRACRVETQLGANPAKPADWARESFQIAKDDAYGRLPEPNSHGSFRLTDDYVTMATQDVSLQLSKAGVRLALILNRALGKP